MSRHHREDVNLRRAALSTRAQLQRIELRAALDGLQRGATASRGVGAVALALARALGHARPAPDAAARARPWMLSAGVLALKALRASPTARWVVGIAAVGGAVWWVARALRAPDVPPVDDSASSKDGSG